MHEYRYGKCVLNLTIHKQVSYRQLYSCPNWRCRRIPGRMLDIYLQWSSDQAPKCYGWIVTMPWQCRILVNYELTSMEKERNLRTARN